MRNGMKVFDADAHVIYPHDLWERFLDERHRHRVGRRAPAGLDTYNPVVVDGRWVQHPTVLYGQFQKAIGWTTEDMIAQYGEEMVVKGFTGERVARALEAEGVDIMVIYGPEYDMWLEGIDPELQAAMARAYNRWGAEMRETSGGRVLRPRDPSPSTTCPAPSRRSSTPTTTSGSGASGPDPTSSTTATWATATTTPSTSCSRISTAPSPPTSTWGSNGASAGSDRFTTFTEWHTVVHAHEAQSAIAVDDLPRRLRAVPAAAVRLHGGRVRVAAVVAAPDRRAARAGRGGGVPRAHPLGEGQLPGATAGSRPSARTPTWPTSSAGWATATSSTRPTSPTPTPSTPTPPTLPGPAPRRDHAPSRRARSCGTTPSTSTGSRRRHADVVRPGHRPGG